jgi:uncharacterized membrane protein YdfJ with MMPL/SSD domain
MKSNQNFKTHTQRAFSLTFQARKKNIFADHRTYKKLYSSLRKNDDWVMGSLFSLQDFITREI